MRCRPPLPTRNPASPQKLPPKAAPTNPPAQAVASREVDAEDSSDSDDQPLVGRQDSEFDQVVTPKAKKQRVHPPPDASRAQFQPDQDLPGDSPYSASLDASPTYSGDDNDAPISRSPHRLRSKAAAAAKPTRIGKKKGAL